MENKFLRSFIAVAKHQNFSAAAKSLHTVQPTISRHISELEKELEVKLFERNTHQVSLTKAGEVLFTESIKILENERRVKDRLKQLQTLNDKEIKIGYLATACGFFLPRLVHEYRRQNENVIAHLYEMTALEQRNALIEGEIDLAFCREQQDLDPDLFTCEKLYTDQLVALLPIAHHYADQDEIDLVQLKDETFMLFHPDLWREPYQEIVNLCQSAGFLPNVADHPENMRHLVTAVSSGLGISIVPSCIHFISNYQATCVPIRELTKPIPLYIYYRHLSSKPYVKNLADLCLDHAQEVQNLLTRITNG